MCSRHGDYDKPDRKILLTSLIFDVPLVVAKYEAMCGRTLPGYSKRTAVPDHLKAFNYFKTEPPWLRDELVRDAYLATAKSFSWLYDIGQVVEIWARHPLRRPYQPPAGHTLVTRTHLKRVLKLKDAEIAAMAPVVEVESQYQGWIPMYLAAGSRFLHCRIVWCAILKIIIKVIFFQVSKVY